MSAIVDYTDRSTSIIFGDGAGAVLLEPDTNGYGVLDSILKSDGSGCHFLHMKAGGSLHPSSIETVTKKQHFIYQEGKTVFKFAVVGMAAYFTAIVRAPLTGILLITEMTGSYEQMYLCVVAEYLRDLPIYEALLERDLERGGFGNGRAQPIVAEFEIEPDAPFAGRLVHELGLPSGCILVRSALDGTEQVVTANTRLQTHMKITAVIAPKADNALEILRRGCTTA